MKSLIAVLAIVCLRQAASINWGILGPGKIAYDFAVALQLAGSNITAVAAGTLPDTLHRAKVFADKFHIPRYYGDYESIANDEAIDIVYIATLNFCIMRMQS